MMLNQLTRREFLTRNCLAISGAVVGLGAKTILGGESLRSLDKSTGIRIVSQTRIAQVREMLTFIQ